MLLRNKKIDDLNKNLEKIEHIFGDGNLFELLCILGDKKEIIKRNLLAGIFRGVGIGIGVTIITAVIVVFLERLVKWNLPVIGKYITDIVSIVQRNMY